MSEASEPKAALAAPEGWRLRIECTRVVCAVCVCVLCVCAGRHARLCKGAGLNRGAGRGRERARESERDGTQSGGMPLAPWNNGRCSRRARVHSLAVGVAMALALGLALVPSCTHTSSFSQKSHLARVSRA